PAHPELIGGHVLVADDHLVLKVEVDDRSELFHLEPLRVRAANCFPVGQDAGGVDGGGIDQGRWRHARGSFNKSCAESSGCRRAILARREWTPMVSGSGSARTPTSPDPGGK